MGGCQLQFRVYQKPSCGTAIAFAEITDVFRAEFSVPYTAVCGTMLEGEHHHVREAN